MPKIKLPSAPPSSRITSRQELGHIIRYMRMQAGLTADEAALAIGVAKATLLRAEQGRGALQFDTLLRIMDGLGIHLHALPAEQGKAPPVSWPAA